MTNKKQLITALTLTTILITGGFGLTQLAYSTGSNHDDDDDDNDWDWKKQDWDKHKTDCKCKQPDKLIVNFHGPNSISETNPATIKIYKKISDIGIKDPIIPEITDIVNEDDITITAFGKKTLDDSLVYQVLVGGSEIARIKVNTECEPEMHIGDTYKNTDQSVILTIVSGSYDDKQSIFNNNDLLCTGATLKVKKTVISDNEDDKFTLQIANAQGGIEATSEPLGDGGTLGPQLLPVGIYTISETGTNLANYNTSFSGDCDKNGKVNLKKGKQAECIITNTKKIPAKITVIKALTNDNNGDAEFGNFHIQLTKVDGSSPTDLMFDDVKSYNGEVQAGTYKLRENPSGFTASYTTVLITGDDACPQMIDESFTLNEGEHITCTIYNDDNFVPGGSEGNDPTVKVIVKVNELDNVSPDQFTFTIGTNTLVTNGGDPVNIPKDTPVQFNQNNFIDDTEGIILPTSIQGDGNCPDVIGTGGSEEGFITLSANQNIECIVVYGVEIEPGVIFHYNTMEFSYDDDGYGDSCDNEGTMPCIELANAQDGTILIVDEKITSDTIIFLFSVIEQDKVNNPRQVGQMGILAPSPFCIFSGVSPHDEEYSESPGDPDLPPTEFDNPVNNPSGVLGFAFTCTLADPSGKYNVNYALIETV